MTEILVRPALPADYDAIGALSVAAYRGDGQTADGHPYEAHLSDAAARARAAEVLVAVDETTGAVLGSVTFVLPGSPLADLAREGEAEFRMLAVSPAAQGRGIGTALLQRVLDDSRAAGRRAVVCSSQPTMRAAHTVYTRLGFRRLPERDWSPVPGVDLLAFGVAL